MNALLLSKLATELLLPPGCLVLLAVAGLLFRRRWWGKTMLLASIAAMWLLSTAPVSSALTRPLEFAFPVLTQPGVEQIKQLPAGSTAIVLLGGGIREQAPEYGGVDELNRFTMMRTLYAADLARQTGLPVYASGGRPLSRSKETEGAIMRRQLVRFGVPEDKAFAEEASNNTWQNAEYLDRLLKAKDIRRVVLVTSAWHMPRSVWCFQQQGLRVISAPTDFMSDFRPHDARGLLPDAGALSTSSLALHEYLGLFWYRLRYGHDWHWPW